MALKYKALIADLDGTIIPSQRNGIPSERVTKAIGKASELIHVGLATSRPYFMLAHITNHLKLKGPSIISGGSQIINLPEKEFVWEKMIERQDIIETCTILNKIKVPFFIHDCIKDEDVKFSPNLPGKSGHIVSLGIEENTGEQIIKSLSHIKTIVAHKVPSWEKDKIDLMITHTLATKQHAIYEVAKILNIKTHEIIGVGDGYNDFPLLMACGLKIAMGNAVDDLKAIADYVAPSVEEDGIVDIIDKYILNN
ncbi:HAD-IIB family hydrolase [Candidatus Microgenomates bacterium]|nr:MAG: HAD-IIB family hydrolase [Candidatus Microgenomates bacterium]